MHTRQAAVLLALTCLLPASVSAQVGSLRVTFSAPTPASLGKFGDVPVSLHTGIPEIAVPIFTVKGKTLELPITLRYHAGGIRVEELGSWVGIGWALEVGGTITRTVRGMVDDHPSGFYNTGHSFYNSWSNPTPEILQNILNKWIDPEPDQFFFNFGGRSGQFVMGPTSSSDTLKEVRTIPHQKMKIEPVFSGSAVLQWLITPEDGTRYTFAARDETTDYSFSVPGSDTGGGSHTSTWHLTEIRAPGGDVINLYYSQDTVRHRLSSYVEKFSAVAGSCALDDYQLFSEHLMFSQRLDSIKSTKHTVVFSAPTRRSDALSPSGALQERKLDLITVRAPSGMVIRSFRLEHDYFASDPGSPGRLRLKNVYEQDSAGTPLPPFTFTYNGQIFPAVTSRAQDHWGYFNGKSNSTLIPTVSYGGSVLPGADRGPDSVKMKIGSLTRITFPTGGYNEFTWEANDYGGIGPNATQPYDWGPIQYATSTSSQFQGLNETTFTINGTSAVPVEFDFTIMPDSCNDPAGCQDSPFVGVRRISDVTDIETWHNSGRDTLLLGQGTYRLRSYSQQEDGDAHVSANWQERIAVDRKLAGGLRVAQILSADGLGNTQIRKYKYTLASNPAKSSGLINAEPAYAYSYSSLQCSYFSRSSQSKAPLGSGASVSYLEVAVLRGATGEYGRSYETFRSLTHAPDGVALYDAWPFSRTTSNEWKRGQRLDAAEYNSAGQTQSLVRSTYSFQDSDPTTTRKFRGISVQPFSAGQYGSAAVYNPFEVISAWAYQSADSTFTYDETGASSFVTARKYEYENATHMQLTRVTETNSDGTKRITRMKYPADYADGSGNAEAIGITALKAAHNHVPVIERWVSDSVGGAERVVRAETNTYRTWGRPLLWQHHVLKSATPVTNFVPSAVNASGLFTRDARYLYRDQIASYDWAGRVTLYTDRWGHATRYTYDGTPDSAFLGSIRRCVSTAICNVANPTEGLIQAATYDPLGNMTSLRDSLTYRRFTYDSFGRLRQVKNHGSTPVQGHGYTYSRTAPNWTFNPSSPNVVVDTTYLQHTPTPLRVVRWTYLDGLGRPIQTVVQDGSTYLVTAQQYDAMGREWRKWKPYPRAVAGYDPSFVTNATAYYNTYHGVATTPYVETLYTADALNRVKRVIPEFLGTAATEYTQYAYGVDADAKQSYTETEEIAPQGPPQMAWAPMKTRSYRDGWGNEVKTILGYGGTAASTTILAYNVLGQRTQATDPRVLITTYTNNTQGHQSARSSPDAGTTSRLYNAVDNLRYSQDAKQAAAGQVYFTSYDFAYRPLTSGLGTATFASLDPNAATPPALETNTANWLTVRAYDAKPTTTTFPWSLFSTQINAVTLVNVYGRLAATANRSNGRWQVQLFSYDADGRVATRHTFTEANGGGVLLALNDSVTYTRDLRDSVTIRRLRVGSSIWHQWYDYDNRGLLWQVFASTSPTKPGTPDVTYTYRPSGSLLSRQFQGGLRDTLRYTIREQLERIGTVESGAGPFAARYVYNPDGTVKQAEFRSEGSPATYKRYREDYSYTYNSRKQLRHAQLNYFDGAWFVTNDYTVGALLYDRSGNLLTLSRLKQAGTPIDDLDYRVASNSNRLSALTEYAAASPETWDGETGGFTYDLNGNMLTAPQPYSFSSANYDHQNLMLAVTRNGVATTYRYNAEGQRIAKQVGGGNTEFYILDGRTTLAVYTVNSAGTPISWHHNIVAADRVVGRQAASAKRYYHTDLLGSTRAVVENGTIVESYDYDPWGVLLEGRILAGPTKEGFTGKERDAETGLDYFGFRYYMPAIGRWTTVDPPSDAFPGWSPYNYVENNPVSYSDPFGLCPSCADLLIQATAPVIRKWFPPALFQPDARENMTLELLPSPRAVYAMGARLTSGAFRLAAASIARGGGYTAGRRFFGATRFRGLIQNRNLADLTPNEIHNAFSETGFTISSHAAGRLRDSRTAALGASTLNDIARLLNKGDVVDAGGGDVAVQLGRLEAIIDPETRVIWTIRPFRRR